MFRNIKSPFVSVRKFDIVKKVTNLESPKAPLYLHENPENFIFRVFYLRGTLTFQEVYKIKSPFVSSRKIDLIRSGRGGAPLLLPESRVRTAPDVLTVVGTRVCHSQK